MILAVKILENSHHTSVVHGADNNTLMEGNAKSSDETFLLKAQIFACYLNLLTDYWIFLLTQSNVVKHSTV